MLLAWITAGLIVASKAGGLELAQRTVSPSGQFVVYGADASDRGSVSDLAERTKKNVLAVLRRRDDWKIPIVINLQPRAANLPELRQSEIQFNRTEAGMKLQLDLPISAQITAEGIERELERVILLEMMYRKAAGVGPGEEYVDPPVWLLDGLISLAPNRDRTSMAANLAVPRRVPSLAEFLREQRDLLDSPARELHRAYSWALLQMLIDSPDGRVRLGNYIDKLSFALNDTISDLHGAFPKLGDLESAWQTKISELKDSAHASDLTFWQTDARLDEILNSKFPAAAAGTTTSLSLEELSRTKVTAPQRLMLQKFDQELIILVTHANPVLRPIVQDYQRIAEQVGSRKNQTIIKRLAELKSLRARLSARMSEIDDYMNWFEAAKLETPSGLFEQGSTAPGEIGAAKRKDALSVYLDAIELEF